MLKNYLITYQVKCYQEKESQCYNCATGRMQVRAINKLQAVNYCLESYDWSRIYAEELGYYAKKIEFLKFISVEILKEN